MSKGKAYLLDLAETKNLVSSLSLAVEAGYGPNYLHTIIESSTGRILITNSGAQILKSVELHHPVANWIVSSIGAHHNNTGNDCKTYVLLLKSIIEKCYEAIGVGDSTSQRSLLSDDFGYIISNVIPSLYLEIDQFCFWTPLINCKCGLTGVIASLKLLTLGYLNSHFSMTDALHLSETITRFIISWCSEKRILFKTVVNTLLDNHQVLVVGSPGMLITSSTLVNGFMISRELCNSKDYKTLNELNDVKFVLLSCSLVPYSHEYDGVIIDIRNCPTPDLMMLKRRRLTAILSRLKNLHVSLLITSLELSALEKAELSNHAVAAIHTVEETELLLVSQMLDVNIIHDTRELSESNVATAGSIKPFQFGGHIYTNLEFDNTEFSTMVVGGRTEGICQQARALVTDSLKTVRNSIATSAVRNPIITFRIDKNKDLNQSECCCKPTICETGIEREHLCSIPAGGAFELVLHQKIAEYLRKQPGNTRGHVGLSILQHSLLSTPRLLHANACNTDKPTWIEILTEAKTLIKGGQCAGIDKTGGVVCQGLPTHSFHNKNELIINVLATMRQLLKVDMIL